MAFNERTHARYHRVQQGRLYSKSTVWYSLGSLLQRELHYSEDSNAVTWCVAKHVQRITSRLLHCWKSRGTETLRGGTEWASTEETLIAEAEVEEKHEAAYTVEEEDLL